MEISEETARFEVSGLREGRDAIDLANALNALSGVAHVGVDPGTQTISVTYDPAYVNHQMIVQSLEATGYPETSKQGR